MATETFIHANGDWRKAKDVYVHANGNWNQCKQIWTRVGGQWQLVFQRAFVFSATASGLNYNVLSAAQQATDVNGDRWDGVRPVIANITVSGVLGSGSASSYNWQQYLANYPDLQASANSYSLGPVKYAQYHWSNFGYPEGRILPVNSSAPAFDTGTLPSGSLITLTIPSNAMILGAGGTGGFGGVWVLTQSTCSPSTPGTPGGLAINVSSPLTIINNGTIGGGGGGGAGGAGAGGSQAYDDPGSSGGGGAGQNPGQPVPGMRAGSYLGSAGTITSGGAAGTLSYQGSKEWASASVGGAGGGLGQAGGASAATNGGPGIMGGAAGVAVQGNSLVSWQVVGTVLGATQ